MKRTKKSEYTIDTRNNVVKRYISGKVYAIRFASGMSEEDVKSSLARDWPQAHEWHAYNEATNTFLIK